MLIYIEIRGKSRFWERFVDIYWVFGVKRTPSLQKQTRYDELRGYLRDE